MINRQWPKFTPEVSRAGFKARQSFGFAIMLSKTWPKIRFCRVQTTCGVFHYLGDSGDELNLKIQENKLKINSGLHFKRLDWEARRTSVLTHGLLCEGTGSFCTS